jgi:formamidopyrimidine-DNA glycosylase
MRDRPIKTVRRRAKYILLGLTDGTVLISHLGMSGSYRIEADPPATHDKHDHVIFTTARGLTVRYHDPRRFGFMLLCHEDGLPAHPLLQAIGPEPLGNSFSGPVLAARLAGRKGPIKTSLLDQKVVAGVGNIYACEALFRAGISPMRRAGTIAGASAGRLAEAIRAVLTDAIRSGGSSLRNYSHTSGELGYFQHSFQVYDKEHAPCPRPECGGIVTRMIQAGRSTFFCPVCQG